ncbi:DNA alkylation repair protein [Rhodococcus sp. NPDC058521]|uniref:DNA alkylation repair protein n=1 Tax=Rhodococcus sp. NPDC058521 TaxID=3346536 RepID=UPI00366177D4
MAQRAVDVQRALAAVADENDAVNLARFFKTGPREYGEGDTFIGVRVPRTRKVVRDHIGLPASEVMLLMDSPVHEHRLAGLLILVEQLSAAQKAGDECAQEESVILYLDFVHRGRVNNWDLVDASAPNVLGGWFFDRPRDTVHRLAEDEDLWRRRVALLTTFGFIRRGDASTTLELAERVLADRRDLTQKATGWMLREVGKRVDRQLLTGFLDHFAADMGRTALTYACEHLTAEERADYRARR